MGSTLDTISCDIQSFKITDFEKLVQHKAINVHRFSSHVKLWEIYQDDEIKVDPLLLTSQSPISSRKCYLFLHIYWKNRVYPGEDYEDDDGMVNSSLPKLSLDEYLSAQVTKMSPRSLQNRFSIQTLSEIMPDQEAMYDIYVYYGKNCSKLLESTSIAFGYKLERILLKYEKHLSKLFNSDVNSQVSLSRIFHDDLEEPKKTVIWKRHHLYRFFQSDRDTSPSLFSVLSLIFPVKEFTDVEELGITGDFVEEYGEDDDDDEGEEEEEGEYSGEDSEDSYDEYDEETKEEEEEAKKRSFPIELSGKLKLDLSSITKKEEEEKKEGKGVRRGVRELKANEFKEGVSYSSQELVMMFRKVCSRILDNVYVGGDFVARRKEILKKHGITNIVNAAKVACDDYFPEDYEYLSFNMMDQGSEPLIGVILKTIDFIERSREENPKNRTFIHCHEGVSRSTAVTIGYVMYKKRLGFYEAMEYVKNIRRSASPNAGFIVQLFQFESILGTGKNEDSTPSILKRLLFRISPLGKKKRKNELVLRICGSQRLDSRTTFIFCVKKDPEPRGGGGKKEGVYLWVGKWASAACLNCANQYVSLLLKYYFGKDASVNVIHESSSASSPSKKRGGGSSTISEKKSNMYIELGQMDVTELIEEENYDDLDSLMSEIPEDNISRENLSFTNNDEEEKDRLLNKTKEFIQSLEKEEEMTSGGEPPQPSISATIDDLADPSSDEEEELSSSTTTTNNKKKSSPVKTKSVDMNFGVTLEKYSVLGDEERRRRKKKKTTPPFLLKDSGTEKEISDLLKIQRPFQMDSPSVKYNPKIEEVRNRMKDGVSIKEEEEEEERVLKTSNEQQEKHDQSLSSSSLTFSTAKNDVLRKFIGTHESDDSEEDEEKDEEMIPPSIKRGGRGRGGGGGGKDFYEKFRLEAENVVSSSTGSSSGKGKGSGSSGEEEEEEEINDYEEELKRLDEEEKQLKEERRLINEQNKKVEKIAEGSSKQEQEQQEEKDGDVERTDYSRNEALKILKEFEESNIIDPHTTTTISFSQQQQQQQEQEEVGKESEEEEDSEDDDVSSDTPNDGSDDSEEEEEELKEDEEVVEEEEDVVSKTSKPKIIPKVPVWKLPGLGSSLVEEVDDDDDDDGDDDVEVNPDVLTELNSLKDIQATLAKLEDEDDEEVTTDDDFEEIEDDEELQELQKTLNRMKAERIQQEQKPQLQQQQQQEEEDEKEEEESSASDDNNNDDDEEEEKVVRMTLNLSEGEEEGDEGSVQPQSQQETGSGLPLSIQEQLERYRQFEKRDRESGGEESEDDDDDSDVSSDTPDDGSDDSEEEEQQQEQQQQQEGDDNLEQVGEEQEQEQDGEDGSSYYSSEDEFSNASLYTYPEFETIEDFYEDDLESDGGFILCPASPDFVFVWVGKEFDVGGMDVEEKGKLMGQEFVKMKGMDEKAPIIVVCEGEMSNNMELFKRFLGEE